MGGSRCDGRVGSSDQGGGGQRLTTFLLDTTILIAHLRGDQQITATLLELLADGHALGTSCVNVAEVERGLLPKERKPARLLLERLRFLVTDREAATRAGRYQQRCA